MQPIEWARLFCPIFYFTPDTITYPVDIGFYCRHATLCGKNGAVIMKQGCVTPALLVRHGYNNPHHYLQIDPEVHKGQPVALEHVPIYAVVTAHFNGEYDSETALEELVSAVEIAM